MKVPFGSCTVFNLKKVSEREERKNEGDIRRKIERERYIELSIEGN